MEPRTRAVLLIFMLTMLGTGVYLYMNPLVKHGGSTTQTASTITVTASNINTLTTTVTSPPTTTTQTTTLPASTVTSTTTSTVCCQTSTVTQLAQTQTSTATSTVTSTATSTITATTTSTTTVTAATVTNTMSIATSFPKGAQPAGINQNLTVQIYNGFALPTQITLSGGVLPNTPYANSIKVSTDLYYTAPVGYSTRYLTITIPQATINGTYPLEIEGQYNGGPTAVSDVNLAVLPYNMVASGGFVITYVGVSGGISGSCGLTQGTNSSVSQQWMCTLNNGGGSQHGAFIMNFKNGASATCVQAFTASNRPDITASNPVPNISLQPCTTGGLNGVLVPANTTVQFTTSFPVPSGGAVLKILIIFNMASD